MIDLPLHYEPRYAVFGVECNMKKVAIKVSQDLQNTGSEEG